MKLVSVVYRTFIDFVRRSYKISNSTSRNSQVCLTGGNLEPILSSVADFFYNEL
jgi:hypothetical protein